MGERAAAHGVEYGVVPLAAGDEVLDGVVEHPVRAERLNELHVAAAAYGVDNGTGVRGELDGVRADAAGTADDQHPLPGPDAGQLAQEVPGGGEPVDAGCGLRIGDVRWHRGERRPLGQALVLGVRADGETGEPEDSVADLVPACRRPDRRDLSGELQPEHADARARAARAEDEPSPPGLAPAHPAISGGDRGGVHSDQHLVTPGYGRRQVDLGEHLGRAIRLEHHRSHAQHYGQRPRGPKDGSEEHGTAPALLHVAALLVNS